VAENGCEKRAGGNAGDRPSHRRGKRHRQHARLARAEGEADADLFPAPCDVA
jgi:hypothetical protein